MAERSDVDHVWVGGIYDDPTDLLSGLEADQLPRASGVGRFIDASARRDRVARIFLSRAGVDDIGVGGRDSDVAHRDHSFLVEYREEHRAGVDGLPDSACRRCDVEDLRIPWDCLDVGHSSGHIRGTDRSPPKASESGGVEWSCELRGEGAGAEQSAGESRKDGTGSQLIGRRLNNRSGCKTGAELS